MHIICIGYGRLGTQVVRVLDTQKHKVVVIDKERSALERRDRDLHAKFLFGNAIDEDLLREAGPESRGGRWEETPDQKRSLKEAWERAQGHAAAAPLPTPAPGARPPDQPFYVVVLGGGRVGYFLTRALRANNIEVTIIEASQKIYDLVTRQVDCPVILGDGSATAT